MQRPMPILPPAQTLDPMKDAAKVKAIDYSAHLVDLTLTPNSITQVKQKMIQ